MRAARRALVGVVAVVLFGLLASPTASAAKGTLAVGMKLTFDDGYCSLGFFAYDSIKDRLAVTSGHCANRLNEVVYNKFGDRIGEVVSWRSDAENSAGKLTGARGYTIIYLYDDFKIQPFFTKVGTISTGDHVSKFGGRSGKTNGHITSIENHPKRPDLALMESDMVQLPGDSGSPWYTSGPTLVGIGSSGDQEANGGGAGSQAQPIGDVIKMVRNDGGRYGRGFNVWTE